MNEKLKLDLAEIEKLEKERRFAVALEYAQKSFRDHRNSLAFMLKLAKLLETCKQYKQAIPIYAALHQAGLKSGSTDLGIILGLAKCLTRTEQYEQAEGLYLQLVEKVKDEPNTLAGFASLRRMQSRFDEAETLAEKALRLDPKNSDALFELAEIAIHHEDFEKALVFLEKNVRRPDVHGDAIDHWLATLERLDRNRYAQDTLEELSRQYPHIVEFVYGFAVLANKAGEISLARPAYWEALKISPDNPRIYYELGVLERVAGNIEKSQELISQSLAIAPDNPAALRTFGSDLKYSYGDENFKRLNYAAAKFSEFAPIEQIHLHYAIAKASEDVGEMDTAFRHYEVAGSKKRSMEDYDEAGAMHLLQTIPQYVTPQNFKLAKEVGCTSEVPVFILGMPRSGTSLMEQILSSHPEVFGAGELKFLTGVLENIGIGADKGLRLRIGDKDPVFPYDDNAPWADRGQKYVDKLIKLADRTDYKRIVDKMPGNFNFLGLIHAILPNAKIIHSRRHPVETCLSCYRIHFAEGHQWSYNLRELGRYYRRYWELMQYWRTAFPGVMYEAVYEENIADVEGSARRLIDYLGLEWHEGCLEFYNTDRPVKTASVTQVRKPIYTTSTNRWRKYEKYLAPLLEELGDIVPEYEREVAHLLKADT